jgi:hypothetical protein
VAEPNASAGFPWFRWSLVVLLIIIGVALILVLGPDSQPVVQPDTTIR